MIPGRRSLFVLLMIAATARPQEPATAADALARAERLRSQGTSAAVKASVDQYDSAVRLARETHDSGIEAAALAGLGRARDALGDKRAAIDLFRQALALQRAAGNHATVSYTLNYMAVVQDFLGQREDATRALDEALVEARTAGDRRVEAVTLNNQGLIQLHAGNRRDAIALFDQALAIHAALGDTRGQATALTNIGTTYDALGEKQKAIEYLERALPLRQRVGDPREEAATLNNLALVYFTLDQPGAALERYQQALVKWHEAGDRGGEGATLHNIASIHEARADYQTAIDRYTEALALHRASGFRAGETNTLNNMGSLYSKLGDHDKAIECYTQALTAERAIGNRPTEASTLSNLAAEQFFLGNRDAALKSFGDALTLWKAVGDISGEARSLLARARLQNVMGQYDEAADGAARARDLAKKANSRRIEALALSTLADTSLDRGKPSDARPLYAEALAAEREIADRGGEAATLLGLARAERADGLLTDALEHANAAIDLVEAFRASVASPDLRLSYFASVQQYFGAALDVLADLQAAHPETDRWARAALETSERARARGFMDMLAEGRVDVRAGVDPALVARAHELDVALASRAERGTRLLAGAHTAAQAAAVEEDVRKLLAERDQVAARIREADPRYAELSRPVPLTAAQIQRGLLDPATALVEFALGETRSYAFVVTPDAVRVVALPPARELNAAADAFFSAARSPDHPVSDAGARLSDLLLKPLAPDLGAKRLVFVASGDLLYVPLAALPAPGTSRPLLLDHEVASIPSAAVLQTLRSTPRTPASTRKLLLIADPVFTADDPRVERADAPTAAAPAASLTRSLDFLRDDAGSARLNRLVGSRREAAGIAALLPSSAITRATDFAANRDLVLHGATGYRIVHFATHALVNAAHPALSGIVLSMVDARGAPRNGYLDMADVFNLKLDADLVVLSACQTALGPNVQGEGLLGLSRAFMYAGSPRVVATIWKVDDTATAALMQRFYEGLLGPRKLTAAAALRAAQLYVRQQPRWRDPYYWAPFVLQGDWR